MRAAALVAACVAALAGCWPAPGQGPDRRADNAAETAITPETVGSLARAWTASTGTAPVGPPVVSPGAVHVRAGATLHTLATADGDSLWTLSPAPPEVSWLDMSAPVVRDGQVAVGFGIGNLGGSWEAGWYDAATGERTSTLDGGKVDSVRGGTVAQTSYGFGSGTPMAVYLNISTFDGEGPDWSGLVDVRELGDGGPLVPVTLGTNGVFHAGRGPLGTTPDDPIGGEGIRMWSLTPPPPCEPPGSTFPFPCPTWARALDGAVTASPVLGDGVVYVGTSAGTFYALDAATGETRWTAAVGAAVEHPPAIARGHAYVPTADGDLVVLPADGCGAPTCAPDWTAPTGSQVSAQPAVGGAVVVTGSADGSVRAFDADGCGAATCDALWSDDVGSAVTGAPAVALGRVYVGTQAGEVVAYAPTASAPPA